MYERRITVRTPSTPACYPGSDVDRAGLLTPRATTRTDLRMLRCLRKPKVRLAVTGEAGDSLLALLQRGIAAIARPCLALAAKRIVVCGRGTCSGNNSCQGDCDRQKDLSQNHVGHLRGRGMRSFGTAFPQRAKSVKQRLSDPVRKAGILRRLSPRIFCCNGIVAASGYLTSRARSSCPSTSRSRADGWNRLYDCDLNPSYHWQQ